MSLEELDLEETLYYERRRFYRVQQILRVTRWLLLTLITASTLYVIYQIVLGFKRINDIEFWKRPSQQVKSAITSAGFDLFVMFMIVLFNCVGYVSTFSESFSLTIVYVFGTTMTLIMSFFSDQAENWPANYRLPLLIFRVLSLQLGILFFFLMRKRRVSS